jgi:hypothetical protein
VLAGGGVEFDVPQPGVDFAHGRFLPLIDGFLIGLTADVCPVLGGLCDRGEGDFVNAETSTVTNRGNEKGPRQDK